MKGELRFAMRTTGEPSVTTDGKTTMALSCVDSWDLTLMVKVYIFSFFFLRT